MKETFIKLDDEYIFLRYNGFIKGRKTLLFVHGLGESGLCFQEVFEDGKFDEFNLLVPDLVGFGRSSGSGDYCFDTQVKRLWNLIEHFEADKEGNELFVIGHSMGGDLTTLLCHEYLGKDVIKKYINIEGDIAQYELFFSSQAVEASEKEHFRPFKNWFKNEFMNDIYHKSGDSLHRYYASLSFCRPEAFLDSAKELCDRNRKYPKSKIQSEIGHKYISLSEKIPTVFCYGDKSLNPGTVCFLETNRLKSEKFEDAGHWVMIDKKEEFYSFLYDFVV